MADFIRSNVKKIISNRIFLGSTYISIVTSAEGAINFLYTVFLGKILEPAQYGIYVPLISLLMIVSIPGLALQMVFSADISRLIHEKKRRSPEGLS